MAKRTPIKCNRMFRPGDLVQISEDLGPSMAYFPSGCPAIVVGSYADLYSGEDHNSYSLYIKGEGGETAWYRADQLTLIESGQVDLLAAWRKEDHEERTQKGDLDWIFANGDSVLANTHGATVASLAAGLGIANLWGPQGEGFVYFRNSRRVMALARPFLVRGDKEGWLEFCGERRKATTRVSIPHVYLASPYAHVDPRIMESRYDAAVDAAGILMSQGVPVYSPIVHNHPIAVAAETELPRDWGFWAKMDLPILSVCSALYVLQLDGWERSIGVAAEIKYAGEMGIPVRYARYGPNDGLGAGLTFDRPTPVAGLR